MAVAETLQAITVLAPLIEKLAGYIADEHDDLPDVPSGLKLDIEMERARARARKKNQP